MCQSKIATSRSIRMQQFLQSSANTSATSTTRKPNSNMSESTKMSDYSTCSDSSNPAATNAEGSNTSDRSLCFSRLAKVYYIPALCEYSTEEISHMWTTDADMERSQASVVDVIRYMRNDWRTSVDLDLHHHGADDDECMPCIRGLEHLITQERMDRRQRHKEKVYDSVLDEQFDQEAKGLDRLDVEAIAAASEKHSQSAKDAALARGTADAEYVKLHVCYDEIVTATTADEDEGEDVQLPQDLTTQSNDNAIHGQPQGNQFFSTLFTALDLSSEEMSTANPAPPTAHTRSTFEGTNNTHNKNNRTPTRKSTLRLKSRQATNTTSASASTASEATDSFYEKLNSLKLRSGAKVLNKLYQDDSKKTNLRFMLATRQTAASTKSFSANSA